MFDQTEKQVKYALEYMKVFGEYLDTAFPSPAPGHHRPTPQERVQWTQQAAMMSPPIPMVRPDGAPLLASPYLTAVSETESGRKELKKAAETMRPEVE